MQRNESGVRQWIAEAVDVRSRSSNTEEWNLPRLRSDDVESFVNDICDVYTDISKMSRMFDELESQSPSTEKLEDMLIEVEIRLAHTVHHWKHARGILQAKDLWMDEDLFE